MSEDENINDEVGEVLVIASPQTSFKVCSCCGKEFITKEFFISDTTHIGNWDEVGLSLHNCVCGSTLSIELFEGSKELAMNNRRKK